MATYSIDTDERTYITIVLFIISFCICLLLNSLFDYLGFSIPLYFESPTPFVVFGLLFKLFDNNLWKVNWVRKILRIETPNLIGAWEGEYDSSYRPKDCQDEVTKGKVKMTIEQSWTKIRIESNFGESNSYSLLAGISVKQNRGTCLKFEYENPSEKNMKDTMNSHSGFTSLKYKQEKNMLEGTYYNDRNRRTFGNLRYIKVVN